MTSLIYGQLQLAASFSQAAMPRIVRPCALCPRRRLRLLVVHLWCRLVHCTGPALQLGSWAPPVTAVSHQPCRERGLSGAEATCANPQGARGGGGEEAAFLAQLFICGVQAGKTASTCLGVSSHGAQSR